MWWSQHLKSLSRLALHQLIAILLECTLISVGITKWLVNSKQKRSNSKHARGVPMKTTYLDNGDGDTLGLCVMQGLTGPNPCILVIRHYWNFEFPAALYQLQSVSPFERLNVWMKEAESTWPTRRASHRAVTIHSTIIVSRINGILVASVPKNDGSSQFADGHSQPVSCHPSVRIVIQHGASLLKSKLFHRQDGWYTAVGYCSRKFYEASLLSNVEPQITSVVKTASGEPSCCAACIQLFVPRITVRSNCRRVLLLESRVRSESGIRQTVILFCNGRTRR